MAKILLASNIAYWPSQGGSEMVTQKILEGIRADFDRVAVFVPHLERPAVHNGVEIYPYSWASLLGFAVKNRPAVYFPNMVHSKMTLASLGPVSRFCGRTVINLVGGYAPDAPSFLRWAALKNVQWFADCAVEVDEHSAEFLTDRATNGNINYQFITQGLNQEDLAPFVVPWPRAEQYFVFAQNLWDWKRPDLFIEAVVKTLPDLKFKIIASDKTGNFIDRTKQLAAGLPNLQILLGLNRADFLKQLAGSSGVINTSKVEGAQPNVLLEAGFLGVPYFCCCPNQNYSHYPHAEMFGSAALLAARLRQLNNQVFEQKGAQLALAKQQFARPEYNWNSVIGRFRQLFLAEH